MSSLMESRGFQIATLLALSLLVICCLQTVDAKPTEYTFLNSLDKGGDCKSNIEKRNLCQYCAKQTKSPEVYPDCCNSRDEVHTFCEAYINFGFRPVS